MLVVVDGGLQVFEFDSQGLELGFDFFLAGLFGAGSQLLLQTALVALALVERAVVGTQVVEDFELLLLQLVGLFAVVAGRRCFAIGEVVLAVLFPAQGFGSCIAIASGPSLFGGVHVSADVGGLLAFVTCILFQRTCGLQGGLGFQLGIVCSFQRLGVGLDRCHVLIAVSRIGTGPHFAGVGHRIFCLLHLESTQAAGFEREGIQFSCFLLKHVGLGAGVGKDFFQGLVLREASTPMRLGAGVQYSAVVAVTRSLCLSNALVAGVDVQGGRPAQVFLAECGNVHIQRGVKVVVDDQLLLAGFIDQFQFLLEGHRGIHHGQLDLSFVAVQARLGLHAHLVQPRLGHAEQVLPRYRVGSGLGHRTASQLIHDFNLGLA